MSNANVSKYKLAISDTTIVKVNVTLKDGTGRDNQYKFDLVCKRKGADELKSQLDSGESVKEIMREVTQGWRGQRLVLESDDAPAEFSADAFDAMLDIAAMPTVLFNFYFKQSSANEKN